MAMFKRVALGAGIGLIAVVVGIDTGCSERTAEPAQAPPRIRSPRETEATKPETPPPAPEPVKAESHFHSSAEWVEIVALTDGATRGDIEAVFDEGRNKFTIDAEGVSEFLLDVCRVKVNWTRPVILKIDGRNSELRKRDYCRLRMRMVGRGAWEVVE